MSDGEDVFLTQSTFCDQNDLEDFSFRFGEPMSEESMDKVLSDCLPRTTKQKNEWALSTLKRWQEERQQRSINENLSLLPGCLCKDIVDMTAEEVNSTLKYFLYEARKVDGSLYPSSTVYALFASFSSTLKMSNSEFNLFEDRCFNDARKCLDAVMKERSACGLGASSRKETEVITHEDEEELWQKGVLGDDSPQKLVDSVLYLTGLNFALRGGREHRTLRMHTNPQVTGPHTDTSGRRYLRYIEDTSKTNPGGLKQRKVKPKEVRAYSNPNNPDRCYVRIFQKYKSLCPQTCQDKSKDALYLTPLRKRRDSLWFSTVPIGHNTLQDTVKRMCKAAGIDGRKTNHSLRATAATRLYQANIDEQTICEHTGHMSNAVRLYKRTSDDQKALVSEVLAKTRKCETATKPDKTVSSTPKADGADGPTTENRPVSFTFNFKC